MVTSDRWKAYNGFRRRQYYSSEPLERFCAMGLGPLEAYRPGIRIAGAPVTAARVDVAPLCSRPVQDESTSRPEGRRPAPPFFEKPGRPAGVNARVASDLISAGARPTVVRAPDTGEMVPAACGLDVFRAFDPARRTRHIAVSAPRWSIGMAEAGRVTNAMRPRTRTAMRGCADAAAR